MVEIAIDSGTHRARYQAARGDIEIDKLLGRGKLGANICKGFCGNVHGDQPVQP